MSGDPRVVLWRPGPDGHAAAAEIVVDGATWGMLSAHAADGAPWPDPIPQPFADLVAAAVANSGVTDEQAALRKVATLVAEGAPSEELFAVVTEEAGRLFAAAASGVIRFEGDAEGGRHGDVGGARTCLVGTRFPVDGADRSPMFLRTAEPGRIEWSQRSGPVAPTVRTQLGFTSTVGAPILVEGRVWGTPDGARAAAARRCCRETEMRLSQFANLVATAILNAQVREETAPAGGRAGRAPARRHPGRARADRPA